MENKLIYMLAFAMIVVAFLTKYYDFMLGEIVEKRYEEAGSQLGLAPQSGGMSPQMIFQSDKWVLVVRGESRRGECYVTEDEWNQVEVGQQVKCGDGRNLTILDE